MQQAKTTFETLMDSMPFLKDLIQDKIAEEIGKKDLEIDTLKANYEELLQAERSKISTLQEDNEKLKIQALSAEQIAAETSLTQQELLELLIELEVI